MPMPINQYSGKIRSRIGLASLIVIIRRRLKTKLRHVHAGELQTAPSPSPLPPLVRQKAVMVMTGDFQLTKLAKLSKCNNNNCACCHCHGTQIAVTVTRYKIQIQIHLEIQNLVSARNTPRETTEIYAVISFKWPITAAIEDCQCEEPRRFSLHIFCQVEAFFPLFMACLGNCLSISRIILNFENALGAFVISTLG